MKMYKISFILLVITCFPSCIKEKQEFTDSSIIESYISAGDPVSVKITRQIPFSEGVIYSDDDINNLAVTFKLNDKSYLLKPGGDGIYYDSSLVVAEGMSMNLSFTYNKKQVSAYSNVPAKPQNFTQSITTYTITRQDTSRAAFGSGGGFSFPDPLYLTWTNTDYTYYLMIVENMETTLDPIRSFGNNTRPGNRFKKTPTNTDEAEVRAQEFQYYGKHRIILYHVLPDYAKLYEANSTSSQNLTNPSTSIVNGYGIFTGLNSDTLYVDVIEP